MKKLASLVGGVLAIGGAATCILVFRQPSTSPLVEVRTDGKQLELARSEPTLSLFRRVPPVATVPRTASRAVAVGTGAPSVPKDTSGNAGPSLASSRRKMRIEQERS